MSRLRFVGVLLLCVPVCAAPKPGKRAKNVILFLADAAGTPTINAASLHGYGEPQKLFVQSWPHIGLSDTSTASSWVADSAAGMTAIVTGMKTQNGVISEGPEAVRGKGEGKPLKTILECAEEHGLSTGVVTDMPIVDATPAACFAHGSDRGKSGEIFLQMFHPRFGDGVDVAIGTGRKSVYDSVAKLGQNLDEVARANRRSIYSSLADVPSGELRPIVVAERTMNVPDASRLAIRALSQNRKGYFLMIEWDAHTDDPRRGLDSLVAFDKLIREIASIVNPRDTLLLFTADHSFDLRLVGGKRGEPLLAGLDDWKKNHTARDVVRIPALEIGHGHTGEEVLAAAQGPGAEQVRGYFPDTRLFQVILNAYGWKPDAQ